ncbi:histone-lysine N-methyltransferase SETMAR [Trichonephila clavipes]|nr:histone-lysine N-methyltransferase SETMAR [Trichonephila clavipes]
MELTREHYRFLIFYDFKAGLNQEGCVQRRQLAFGDESPCHATVFRWFKEFCSGHNSLQDEEHTKIPRSANSDEEHLDAPCNETCKIDQVTTPAQDRLPALSARRRGASSDFISMYLNRHEHVCY